jgi:hypothetical protein
MIKKIDTKNITTFLFLIIKNMAKKDIKKNKKDVRSPEK